MHGMKWLRGALSSPTTVSTSISCVLLLLLVLPISPHVLISVNAQDVNFISIDCGATEDWTSGNISWTPDGNYTSLGRNEKAGQDAVRPYDTLRSFPDKGFNKSCYVFNTTPGTPYLIRAGFLYGNYDNLSQSEGMPSFVLLFGANVWTNVTINSANETVIHEMIALATSNTASVCLGRSSATNHNPFISSLEIRPLANYQQMYSPAHENFLMMTNSRINFGQITNTSVRYPDDEFDRIWNSDVLAVTNVSIYNTTLSTSTPVNGTFSNDFPPSRVMQTARSPFNWTQRMEFTFNAKLGPGQYYLAFYFAELDNRTSDRIMDLSIDDHLIWQALNVSSRGSFETLELYYTNYTVLERNYSLVLKPNKNSTSAPILNAAESYFLKGTNESTFEPDVQGLEVLKSAFNLPASWMGDPCLPSVYKWAWLDCSNNGSQARVIALNLSNMALKSEIPPAIASLSALTSVDFHNNFLSGSIPVSLSTLRDLRFLDLSFNNLSGGYAANLTKLPTFRVAGNPLLCPNGSCETAPIPVSAPSSGSGRLTILMVSILLPAFIVVVGAVWLSLHKRKSQKRKRLFGVPSVHWPPVPPFTEISKAVDPGVEFPKSGTDDVPVFSFDDIKTITNNFENKINAAGGSGALFYGTLSDGQDVVVKLLQSNIKQTPIEFLHKVAPLSYVHHKNLLRPLGFCAEIHRYMFVYENVQKGSLYDHLHNNHAVDWRTRLSILQQVAQGLEHLHCACTPSIIHGNLKSANVLLSGDGLLAKVTDFGIYDLLQQVDTASGYLDPEYFATQRLTKKSDVYSFGVLVLEVVCGRMPFDTSVAKDTRNLIDWARRVYDEGEHERLADARLHDNYNMATLLKVVQLAFNATKDNSDERPTMAELAAELKEVSKMEVGHHVAFAESDELDASESSDTPSPEACDAGLFEEETRPLGRY